MNGGGREASPAERAARLETLEEDRRRLRDREADLEVERIAANAALGSGPADPDVDVATGAAIHDALERRRVLAAELEAIDGRPGVAGRADADRVALARDALRDWLDTARPDRARPSSAAQTALGAVTIAALVAAFTVHLAILVLLVPLGALSGLMWTGHDTAWRRAGARRKFEQTGLAPPAAWEPSAVASRLADLDGAGSPVPGAADATPPRSRAEVALDLEAADAAVRELAAGAGLDPDGLDEAAARRLGLMSRTRRADRELERIGGEIAEVTAEMNEILAPRVRRDPS